MKMIIVGGRYYEPEYMDYELLDVLYKSYQPDEIITGCANGADALARDWAEGRGYPLKVFKADWQKFGGAAGPLRNSAMMTYADKTCFWENVIVVAFPGGRGTRDSINKALCRKFSVLQLPPHEPKLKPNPAAKWRRSNA